MSKNVLSGWLFSENVDMAAVLDALERELARADAFDQTKRVRDQAEVMGEYARSARLGFDVRHRAAVIRLQAERQAGRRLASLGLRGGDRRSKRWRNGTTLDDLGVSRRQSMLWQRVASVSDQEFRRYLDVSRQSHREVTAAGLLRFAGQGPHQGSLRIGTDDVRRRPSDAAPAYTSASSSDWNDLLLELANHALLLAGLLEPVCEAADPTPLRAWQGRVVGRVLREMREIIGRLPGVGVKQVPRTTAKVG